MRRPAVGTKMYTVQEHYYHPPGHLGPEMEYCVCEAVVEGFFKLGYTEMRVDGPDPDGHMTPYRYRMGDIGKRIFPTPRDAALLAEKLTNEYEKRWENIMGADYFPMRRTWKKLLNNPQEPKRHNINDR